MELKTAFQLNQPPAYTDMGTEHLDGMISLKSSSIFSTNDSVLRREFFHQQAAAINPSTNQCNSISFPKRFYRMLEDIDINRTFLSDIISWSPNGCAVMIHKPHDFAEIVMPVYFSSQSKFASFQRQLNNYGFERIRPIHMSAGNMAYFHPEFCRDSPHLLDKVVLASRGDRRRRKANKASVNHTSESIADLESATKSTGALHSAPICNQQSTATDLQSYFGALTSPLTLSIKMDSKDCLPCSSTKGASQHQPQLPEAATFSLLRQKLSLYLTNGAALLLQQNNLFPPQINAGDDTVDCFNNLSLASFCLSLSDSCTDSDASCEESLADKWEWLDHESLSDESDAQEDEWLKSVNLVCQALSTHPTQLDEWDPKAESLEMHYEG